MKIKEVLIIFLILQFSHRAWSQAGPVLDSFTAIENNGKVFLHWVMSAGTTCNGITIYRSADGFMFDEIGEIPGLCGSTTEPQPYDFTDLFPVKNSINYYRLELGSVGFTQVVSVEYIVLNENGFQVRPNPSSDEVRIFFENDNGKEYALRLYSLDGKIILSMTTTEDFFIIDTDQYKPSIYPFSISPAGNNAEISGKISVIR